MQTIASVPTEIVLLCVGLAAGLFIVKLLLWQLLRLSMRLGRASLERLAGSRAVVYARPWREWARLRWPRVYTFTARRLSPYAFTGLPLTLLAVAAIYLVTLFSGLVEDVLEADDLEQLDQMLFGYVAPWRDDALVTAFSWITDLGSMATLTAVAIVSTGFLWAFGPHHYIAGVWLTVIGSQLTTWGGKFIIDRPRPDFELGITAYSASFPSGHSTGAFAVYGVIAYVLARDLDTPRQRFELVYWSAVLIGLVGFSRVFISVHYPSDVAAGFLVGGFWLLAGIALAEIMRLRGDGAVPPPFDGNDRAGR